MRRRVLVTDGEQRAALSVVRSLGKAGHAVHVASARTPSLAGASRFAAAEARVPDALLDPEGFLAALRELVERWRIDLLIPISEASLLAALAAREGVGDAQLPFPELAAFRRVTDKAGVLEVAREVGIATPGQWTIGAPEEVGRLGLRDGDFPLVLKPSRSVGDGAGGRVKLDVSHVADRRSLAERVAALPAAAFPLLVQQRVVGPGVGIFLLVWEGRLVASFAHRRIREKPPSGGVSVYRESIAADPGLVELSRELLDRLGWWGVAMVEYKLDAATGTPYLMEINGRFWGSLQLAVDAGVDFPALFVEAASGRAPPPVTAYRTGVRCRWWWGEVDHLLARLRRSPEELALPPDAPGRWRSLLDFLILWRPGDRNEILRLGDPSPIVRETLDWFRFR